MKPCTKLNASGSGLVWSTYFGGTAQDYITSMAVDAAGGVVVVGYAESGDLPGLSQAPAGCRPTMNQPLAFVTRIAADGSGANATQVIYGAHACLYANCFYTASTPWMLALRSDGTAAMASANNDVAIVDPAAPSRLACLTDPADNVQLRSVSPGQLVSIFGNNLASAVPKQPSGGPVPGFNAVNVTFNGVQAPVLYSSGQQINVQVPYEIAGAGTVDMRLDSFPPDGGFSESQTLTVAARQPAIFLAADAFDTPAAGTSVCGKSFQRAPHALALNPDGAVNDCANPAPTGSMVTIFLNGMGVTAPAQSTGVIATAPPIALSPAVESGPFPTSAHAAYLSTTNLPGAVSGVAQVRIQLPPTLPNSYILVPVVAGVGSREAGVLIWTK